VLFLPQELRSVSPDSELLASLTIARCLLFNSHVGDLARVAAFDHTMRFAYGMNVEQGIDESPSVQYWRGRHGEVDFVFAVDGTPVPIGLSYRPREREATLEAVREFKQTYDTPLGVLLIGDTVRGADPIQTLDEGIIQLPYWFYLMLC
jgi:predicted AAA+ superfamily ATPase